MAPAAIASLAKRRPLAELKTKIAEAKKKDDKKRAEDQALAKLKFLRESSAKIKAEKAKRQQAPAAAAAARQRRAAAPGDEAMRVDADGDEANEFLVMDEPPKAPLPADWTSFIKCYSQSTPYLRPYYFNTRTGATQWEKPE